MGKRLLALLLLCLLLCSMVGCGDDVTNDQTNNPTVNTPASSTTPTTKPTDAPKEHIDYVAKTKLDLNSNTKKLEVTIHAYIDGDTTHFIVPRDVCENGILKARYMGVNTPESTGKIEEWGKKASTFTYDKLRNAISVIVESNDDQWNMDSSGERHLVYVWYKPSADADYRCLNLELIQNGLSIACGTVADRYGQAATDAFQQAKREKLHVFSGEKDPGFHYGDAYEIDLKGLRTNLSLYVDMKVAFEGVVTGNSNNSVYVEEYDAETDMYYGISVYYGFETGALLTNLSIGNRVRVVGKVTLFDPDKDGKGTWQVSGVAYREFKPNDPGNTQVISTGHYASNVLTSPDRFNNGLVDVEVMTGLGSEETVLKTFKYSELVMNTSVTLKDLYVSSIRTDTSGDNKGTMTLTCTSDGQTIYVHTVVLRDEDGNIIDASAYLHKTIDVVGIVGFYSTMQQYQIEVLKAADIFVH